MKYIYFALILLSSANANAETMIGGGRMTNSHLNTEDTINYRGCDYNLADLHWEKIRNLRDKLQEMEPRDLAISDFVMNYLSELRRFPPFIFLDLGITRDQLISADWPEDLLPETPFVSLPALPVGVGFVGSTAEEVSSGYMPDSQTIECLASLDKSKELDDVIMFWFGVYPNTFDAYFEAYPMDCWHLVYYYQNLL